MIQIARWKIILIVLTCMFGVLYSAPNFLSEQTRTYMAENLPGWLPHKSINLGLDLRGGAHLLYSVDVDSVFVERAELIVQDLRKELRSEKVSYRRIGKVSNGVRITLRDEADGEDVRKLLRRVNPNLDIVSEGAVITATLNEAGRKAVFDQTIAQSIEIVRRRVDELGTTEPIIQRQGDDRILVQAPGANAEDLKAIIGKTAKLTFHLLPEPGSGAAGTLSLPYADNEGRILTINRRAMLTGDMLDNAQPNFQDGSAVISFRLNNVGARRFCEITRKNIQKPFAIVLDNQVLSAPVIQGAICGGSGVITGNFTVASANELATLLRAGALPAPMEVIEERTVGPSLGADSVEAGKMASLIGLAAVLVFMALTYSLFGVFANIALVVNVALIVALLSGLQATLTLPGIAGIVLTIGMAVDANVLIFERIREEIALGRSPINAIDAGYRNAMSTIVDSNLTTLIAAFILFSFGTGPIKGFAVTLGVGILTSFFSAIMVTRLLAVSWFKAQKKIPEALPI